MIKIWLLALVAGLCSPALVAGEKAGAEDATQGMDVGTAARLLGETANGGEPEAAPLEPGEPIEEPGAAQQGVAQPEPELIRIEPGASGIYLESAWVRAMPPFQPNSAGYMTVINRRESAIGIVGASSSVARKTELHTTRKVDGLMRMEKLEGLAVAPGERSELAPGGNHLMLIGLAFRPVPGDDITLCLELASGEEICTRADVRRDGKPSSHNHH